MAIWRVRLVASVYIASRARRPFIAGRRPAPPFFRTALRTQRPVEEARGGFLLRDSQSPRRPGWPDQSFRRAAGRGPDAPPLPARRRRDKTAKRWSRRP